MIKVKNKYRNSSIELWLVKVILLFSVFCFSGFNKELQYAFLETEKTELVELRKEKVSYSLKEITQSSGKIISTSFRKALKTINDWALLNFNQIQIVQYKAVVQKFLTYSTILKLPIKKLPLPSEEKASYLSIE